MDRNHILIILLSLVVFCSNFWGTSVYVLDEAKNAGCAMEMYQRGDWVIPTFNNELRTDKPPLHYFFMMLAYHVFGISPFAARLFSCLAGVLLIVLVYHQSKKIFDVSVAFWSALALISSLQVAIQFHLAVPDPYLILLLTASIFFFYDGFVLDRKPAMMLFYVSAALGFLTKGLIAIVLPGMIILLYMILQRQWTWKDFGRLKLTLGIPLFMLIAFPWYIAVGLATDWEWLSQFFFKHNVSRFTETMEGHRGFPLSPFVITLVALLPFSVFAPQAIVYAWKQRKKESFLMVCFLVLIVIPGFFSLSRTILPNYPAPAFPFLAILLGYYISNVLLKKPVGAGTWISLIVHFILAMAIPVGVYFGLSEEAALQPLTNLSYFFVILPLGALISLLALRKSRFNSLVVLSGAWILMSIMFFYYVFPVVDKRNPVAESKGIWGKDYQVAYYKGINPAFIFALEAPVRPLQSPEEVNAFMNEGYSRYVITQKRYLNELDSMQFKIVLDQKDLFENRHTIILTR